MSSVATPIQQRQISFNLKRKSRGSSSSPSPNTSASKSTEARKRLSKLQSSYIGESSSFRLCRKDGQSLGLCLAMDTAGHSGRAVIFAVRPDTVASEAGVPPCCFLTKVDGERRKALLG